MLFTSNGGRIITSGLSGVRIWNLADGASRFLGEGLTASITRDDRRLFVADSDLKSNGWAGVYDLETGAFRPLPSHERATFITLNPTETTVVTGGFDGVARVSSHEAGEPHLLFGHDGWVDVEVSPDGRWIASGGDDGSLRLWPMPDLSKPPLHTLPRDELIAKLKTLTNLRVVRDEETTTGWKLTVDPFPGWETVPSW
jgi:WD40 repeat protein